MYTYVQKTEHVNNDAGRRQSTVITKLHPYLTPRAMTCINRQQDGVEMGQQGAGVFHKRTPVGDNENSQ